jgi:lipopolysaccharide/colanic/teichoic acid biosynthesis glycosyltransferase
MDIAPGPARRCLDVVASGLALAVFGLPLLVLLVAVRATSRGPALFRQVRVGQGGRPFVMFKLRTMRTGITGPDVTASADVRVTRLGAVLRRTSLDELPQLWNVLRGDMTLVGPRPETVALAARYPADCRWVFAHRPGLTGPTQVRMRDALVLPPGAVVDIETYLTVLVPARTAIDATYLRQPSFSATVSVLVETVRHLTGERIPAGAS